MKVMWLLTYDTVRKVCIDNDFYNAGNNEEYENMLSMVDKKEKHCFAAEDVLEIAYDIEAHSTDDDVTVELIIECLLNAAYTIVR